MALRISKSLRVAAGSNRTLRKIFGATAAVIMSLALPNHLSAQANEYSSGRFAAATPLKQPGTQGVLNILPAGDSFVSGEKVLTWPTCWKLSSRPLWEADCDNRLEAHRDSDAVDFTAARATPWGLHWEATQLKALDVSRFTFHFHTWKLQWAVSPASLSRSRRGRRPLQ